MLVGAVLASMWMSNTAASLIMLPIGLALIDRVGPSMADQAVAQRFSSALLLAIAYGASLGGMGTPIGSPPNLIYLAAVDQFFGVGSAPGFLGWMAVAVPVVIVMSVVVYLYLVHHLHLPKGLPGAGREVLVAERAGLGHFSREERVVAGVFAAMLLLWFTRRVDLGGGQLIGWSPWLGLDATVDDSTVAVLGALVLFLWPTGRTPPPMDGQPALLAPTPAVPGKILDWPTARRIPWDVALLFGGGVALARACMDSGLSTTVANGLAGLNDLHPLLIMMCVCLAVSFLTNVTSNTAITTLLMPILAAAAVASGSSSAMMMLPAALAASMAFMLPVATPPNAVVYGSGRLSIGFMMRTGFWMNLAGVPVIALLVWLLAD
jgi:sodium-dependent dicarboxylate transporter 2/3/5